MGDWDYYIVRMTMREVDREVQLASELWEDKTLSDAIQRVLDESRVKQQIVNFLSRRDDRFFSSLVVAAIGGNPSWTQIPSRFGDTFGELAFQNDPRYFALDGQHRLKAVKELLADPAGAPPGFADEQLSVVVVVREDQKVSDNIWLQRYRRLFSSLNRYAKPTDADTNIIMDEDDLFAILTRRLITDHEFFRAQLPETQSFRVQTKGKNLKSGAPHFISLQTLYAVNQALLMATTERQKWGTSKELKHFIQNRPEENLIDQYYAALENHWNALLQAVPDLRREPERMRTHVLPSPNPEQLCDHLLFWPIGQELLAKVARSMLDGAGLDVHAAVDTMAAALRPLAAVPWDLHAPPWRHLLLVREKGDAWRIRSEDRKPSLQVADRLLRWIAGIDALTDDDIKELLEDWRKLLYTAGPDSTDDAADMWQEVSAAREAIVTDGTDD